MNFPSDEEMREYGRLRAEYEKLRDNDDADARDEALKAWVKSATDHRIIDDPGPEE